MIKYNKLVLPMKLWIYHYNVTIQIFERATVSSIAMFFVKASGHPLILKTELAMSIIFLLA